MKNARHVGLLENNNTYNTELAYEDLSSEAEIIARAALTGR